MTPTRLHARCPRCPLTVPVVAGRYARHRLAGARGGAAAVACCPGTDLVVEPAAVHAWLDAVAAEARDAARRAEQEAQRAAEAAARAAAERTAVLAWVGRARAQGGAR